MHEILHHSLPQGFVPSIAGDEATYVAIYFLLAAFPLVGGLDAEIRRTRQKSLSGYNCRELFK